jgi:hypothetical protein
MSASKRKAVETEAYAKVYISPVSEKKSILCTIGNFAMFWRMMKASSDKGNLVNLTFTSGEKVYN